MSSHTAYNTTEAPPVLSEEAIRAFFHERHLVHHGKTTNYYAFRNSAEDLTDTWAFRAEGSECEPMIEDFVTQALAAAEFDAASEPLKVRDMLRLVREFADEICDPVPDMETIERITTRVWLRYYWAQLPSQARRDGKHVEPWAEPSILYEPHKLPEAVAAAERALIRRKELAFQHEGRTLRSIAYVGLDDPDHDQIYAHGGAYAVIRQRRAGSVKEHLSGQTGAEISHLDIPALRIAMMNSAKFFKPARNNKSDREPDKAHDDIVQSVRSMRGGGAPTLQGLLPAPTVLLDGSTIEAPGYDTATGLYATFDEGGFPPLLPDMPQSAARAAYKWLREDWLGEFSFADELDAACCVAALMTGLERRVCGIAPAFGATAGEMSVGKTTAMQAVAAAVEGAPPPMNSWPSTEDEVRKTIFSALRAGRPLLVFDNLPVGSMVQSPELAKLLTSETIDDRILQQSETATVPANVLVMLTGNNLILSEDLASRVIEIRLQARDENPTQRKFKRDVVEWTLANRGRIVGMALAIIKGYADAGMPNVGGTVTRFPAWDVLVRRSLMWASGQDIGSKFTTATQADPAREALRDIKDAWLAAFGDKALTAGEIVKAIDGEFVPAGAEPTTARGVLREVLRSVANVPPRLALNSRRLGIYLKQYLGRPVDGVQLASIYDKGKKQHLWSFEPVPAARG